LRHDHGFNYLTGSELPHILRFSSARGFGSGIGTGFFWSDCLEGNFVRVPLFFIESALEREKMATGTQGRLIGHTTGRPNRFRPEGHRPSVKVAFSETDLEE
jgi:hypothetical protein